ncbi:MAG TPA: hypothetical protein VFB58_13995 [Chloroflexota bacterium]|nr:hypothetical protein [Chloroflexota bacterium]
MAGHVPTVALIIGMAAWPLGSSRPAARDVHRMPAPPANIRITRDRCPAHAEPSLAINPRHLLGAAQYLSGAGLPLAGAFASFEGGRSWRDNEPLPLPAVSLVPSAITVPTEPDEPGMPSDGHAQPPTTSSCL